MKALALLFSIAAIFGPVAAFKSLRLTRERIDLDPRYDSIRNSSTSTDESVREAAVTLSNEQIERYWDEGLPLAYRYYLVGGVCLIVGALLCIFGRGSKAAIVVLLINIPLYLASAFMIVIAYQFRGG